MLNAFSTQLDTIDNTLRKAGTGTNPKNNDRLFDNAPADLPATLFPPRETNQPFFCPTANQ